MSNPYDILATDTGSDAEEDGGSITDRAAGGTDSWSEGLFADYADEPAPEASWHQLTLAHCRAPFLKNGIPRVCGNDRSKCSRPDHKKATIIRSDPGFYIALAPITKNSKIDGAGGTYKSITEMAADLRATETRLHQEIKNLATSPGYQETPMDGVSQPAYIAGSPPVPDDSVSQSIRTMTDQMENRLDQATADALSSPPPPPKTMFNLAAERLRQTITRTTARVGAGGVFTGTTPVSKPGARGRALAMGEDDFSYDGSLLRATSGLVTAPPHRYSPTRDRAAQRLAWLQEQVESYRQEAQAAEREEEDHRLQEEEDLLRRRVDSNLSTHEGFHQQVTPPPTIHIDPQVAALEAQLRSLKTAAAKKAEDDYTDGAKWAARVDPRINTHTNQLARAEKRLAGVSRAGHVGHGQFPSQQNSLPSHQTGAVKSPPQEVAYQRHVASLRAQVAAFEAALEQDHVQPSPENEIAALTTKVAQLKTMVGQQGPPLREHAATSRARVIPEPASSPTDPRLALLQAQYEVLTAQLAGTGRPATQSPPVPEDDPYVAQMIRLVAGLEEQVRAQKADHLQPVTAEPMLDPEAQRVADLEATIRRLSAELKGTGNSAKFHEAASASATTSATQEPGHQGANRSGSAVAFEGQDGRQSSPLAGTGRLTGATGHFAVDDIVSAKKDVSVGDVAFGVSIKMPRNVLDVLCPKGMPDATKLQIAEAGLDVASLPGKYKSSSAMDIVDVHQALANTMGQAMELVQNQQNSHRARDLSWQSERRNALDSIKTQDQLLAFQEELNDTSDEALDSSENQMRHVLADLCLDPEVVEYYVNTSHFPTIIRKTLEYYKALVDHVVTLSNKYGFALAQIDLQYYAAKLALRRKGSHSRLEVLLKVYCDLRDGHREKFIDSSLQQKKNGIFYLRTLTPITTPKASDGTPPRGGDTPTPPKASQPKSCRRCNSKLHPNSPQCPFYHADILSSAARKLAIECQNANNFESAAKAAVAKYLAAQRTEGTPAVAPPT